MEVRTGPGPGYRIDELARAAGTTVRNVRAYQDRGLLHPPRRTGRAGIYSEGHLVRLRLIGSLLQRGYTLANIGELLRAWEQGQDVAALLGLELALGMPAAHGNETLVDGAGLAAAFGPDAGGLVEEAVAIGLLEPAGPGTFRMANPSVLEVGRLLVGAGVPLGSVLEAARQLRVQVHQLAALFVALVEQHVVDPMGDPERNPMPAEAVNALAVLVGSLRPLATQVVAVEVGLALEQEIRRGLGDYLVRRARQHDIPPRSPEAGPVSSGPHGSWPPE
jgi:DNA-binding transcriptional MerR regulator